MTKDTINRIVSGVIGLALIGVGVYLLTVEQDEWGAAVIFGGLGTLGLRPVLGAGPKGPPDQGAGGASALLVACVLAASTLSTACGASALGTQARVAGLVTIAAGATGEAVDAARAASMDRVEAAHPTDPEHDEAIDAEAARWRPVGQALDALREVLITWGLSLQAAAAVGEDGLSVLWPRLLALASQAVAIYGRVAALATELGAEGVPALPTAVTAFLGGVQ